MKSFFLQLGISVAVAAVAAFITLDRNEAVNAEHIKELQQDVLMLRQRLNAAE